MEDVTKTKSKNFLDNFAERCIGQRYVFGMMAFLAVANAYGMRSVLNIAITEMVRHPKSHNIKFDSDACPGELTYANNTHPDNEFEWDEKTQGLILSAFFWGYVITHVPGGILAEKYGGKHVLGTGLLITAILTILTPPAARMGAGWLIALRFLEGLGEGTTIPALNNLLAHWVPARERGKIGAFVFAGNQIGIVFCHSMAGFLLKHWQGGWPNVFYLFGTLCVIWYIFWILLCYSSPVSHPFISEKEKAYLHEHLANVKERQNLPPTPWKSILTSIPLWGLVIGQIGHDWALFSLQTDLPKYMRSVLKFPIEQNGILTSLPFLAMWVVALSSGVLTDFLLEKKYLTVGTERKIFTTIASLGPATGVIAASYAGCDKAAVATLFTAGMAFMGFFYSSLKLNCLDLSPNYSGTLMALVNGIGAVSGMVTPILIGYLTPNMSLLEWRSVFWINFGVVLGTNVLYVIMGSGDIQPWDNPTKSREAI